MDQTAFKTIPLETAMEYYTDAATKGRKAGAILERQKIMELLKKHGQYEALLLLKNADRK